MAAVVIMALIQVIKGGYILDLFFVLGQWQHDLKLGDIYPSYMYHFLLVSEYSQLFMQTHKT